MPSMKKKVKKKGGGTKTVTKKYAYTAAGKAAYKADKKKRK
tara:strand:+ start:672 stop:794 length:123 start_codon:yes stop_codon:yes gene_type:complete